LAARLIHRNLSALDGLYYTGLALFAFYEVARGATRVSLQVAAPLLYGLLGFSIVLFFVVFLSLYAIRSHQDQRLIKQAILCSFLLVIALGLFGNLYDRIRSWDRAALFGSTTVPFLIVSLVDTAIRLRPPIPFSRARNEDTAALISWAENAPVDYWGGLPVTLWVALSWGVGVLSDMVASGVILMLLPLWAPLSVIGAFVILASLLQRTNHWLGEEAARRGQGRPMAGGEARNPAPIAMLWKPWLSYGLAFLGAVPVAILTTISLIRMQEVAVGLLLLCLVYAILAYRHWRQWVISRASPEAGPEVLA